MELAANQQSLLDQYLQSFRSLIGDRRTEALFRGVVAGIIAAESLVCSRIAAFSPCASQPGQEHGAEDTADGEGGDDQAF